MSKVKPATVAKQKFNQDIHFLDGPSSQNKEFFLRLESHVSIYTEIQNLTLRDPVFPFFGSARTEESHPVCKQSYEIGKRIAAMGWFSHDNLWGPGVMEKLPTGELWNGGQSVVVPFVCPESKITMPTCTRSVDFPFFVRRYCWWNTHMLLWSCPAADALNCLFPTGSNRHLTQLSGGGHRPEILCRIVGFHWKKKWFRKVPLILKTCTW